LLSRLFLFPCRPLQAHLPTDLPTYLALTTQLEAA